MPFGNTSKFTLEICCSDFESAKLAEKHGADRIELCQNLEQGGVTPSYGLIKKCVEKLNIPVHVLIRPRTGHFGYLSSEFDVMREDVKICKELGCAGVVIGVGGHSHKVDGGRNPALVEDAGGMAVTFHRAFDDMSEYSDMLYALEAVIKTGCSRLLTSGGAETAEEGIDQVAELVQEAEGRIIIMAGSGVTPENVKHIIEQTGVREVHTSAKRVKKHTEKNQRRGLFEAHQLVVDGQIVSKMVEVLESIQLDSLPPLVPRAKRIKLGQAEEIVMPIGDGYGFTVDTQPSVSGTQALPNRAGDPSGGEEFDPFLVYATHPTTK
ncbi:hypothetical protein OHC33_003088 [Knufia fluminis]|uniref:Copper homeostasis protein cutC homolog n=1 Tax=Knufia fluminis TaxID=191047 RepID=A0AAN8EJP1_9EURO|nr:hypothetical protein OHC33_003088 [Knufia fluminis]